MVHLEKQMRLSRQRHRAVPTGVVSRFFIELRSLEVIRARWPAALFLKRIFCDRVSMSASIVGVFNLTVARCELFPPALTYSKTYVGYGTLIGDSSTPMCFINSSA